LGIGHSALTVNDGLTGASYAARPVAVDSKGKFMDAQRIAVDAVVALDPKRLTFKGLQAMARA
jgi:hypothetical protein